MANVVCVPLHSFTETALSAAAPLLPSQQSFLTWPSRRHVRHRGLGGERKCVCYPLMQLHLGTDLSFELSLLFLHVYWVTVISSVTKSWNHNFFILPRKWWSPSALNVKGKNNSPCTTQVKMTQTTLQCSWVHVISSGLAQWNDLNFLLPWCDTGLSSCYGVCGNGLDVS